MLFWLIAIPYFMIGAWYSRWVFITILGDSPRTLIELDRHDPDYREVIWSRPFLFAFWTALAAIVAFPLVFLFRCIFKPTPHEALKKKELDLRSLEARYKEMEREVLAFGKNLS